MLKPEDWTPYPNFRPHEFACSHTGQVNMAPDFLARLQLLRSAYGGPLVITSGYRHPTHPREESKAYPGPHTTGRAADVRASGPLAYEILHLALAVGFTGIGIQQRGAGRFLHLDTIPRDQHHPRPYVWSY